MHFAYFRQEDRVDKGGYKCSLDTPPLYMYCTYTKTTETEQKKIYWRISTLLLHEYSFNSSELWIQFFLTPTPIPKIFTLADSIPTSTQNKNFLQTLTLKTPETFSRLRNLYRFNETASRNRSFSCIERPHLIEGLLLTNLSSKIFSFSQQHLVKVCKTE